MSGDLLSNVCQALLMALGMAWKTGWTLVLGFLLSAILQNLVPADRIRQRLGGSGIRPVGLAALLGAASSSCSYAAAAIMRTLFRKGASLTTSLAFLFAATNLVLELGIILYLLLGWQFMLAEWLGGVVLIAVMALVVRLTYPRKLAEAGRDHGDGDQGGDDEGDERSWRRKLADSAVRGRIAGSFVMEWSMLWKDLLIGFLVGGFVAVFVPTSFWQSLFLTDAPAWLRVPANTLIDFPPDRRTRWVSPSYFSRLARA